MERWDLRPARDIGLPLSERLRSPDRENSLFETGIHLTWCALTRIYLAGAHRFQVKGKERIPPPPFILAANHSSHLDTVCLTAILPVAVRMNVFPLAAGDTFFETPIRSAFAAAIVNALPLSRRRCHREEIENLRRRLHDDHCGYILFPEGTRTRTGQMGLFKDGVGMLVAGTPVPVIPCRFAGTYEAMPVGRWIPRWRTVRLIVGEPLRFDAVPNDREGWRIVARGVERAVTALGEKTPLPRLSTDDLTADGRIA